MRWAPARVRLVCLIVFELAFMLVFAGCALLVVAELRAIMGSCSWALRTRRMMLMRWGAARVRRLLLSAHTRTCFRAGGFQAALCYWFLHCVQS